MATVKRCTKELVGEAMAMADEFEEMAEEARIRAYVGLGEAVDAWLRGEASDDDLITGMAARNFARMAANNFREMAESARDEADELDGGEQ